MAREPECKRRAVSLPSDYGMRAALALDELIPPPHRDKAVQRLFDVSLRMAKYLRRGQHWTIERLTQASRVLDGFDICVASPERLHGLRMEMDELEKRLARLEQERLSENARGLALFAVAGAGKGAGRGAQHSRMVRPDASQAAPVAPARRRA